MDILLDILWEDSTGDFGVFMHANEKDARLVSASAEEDAAKVRSEMELLQSKLNAAKIAYYNRSELDGKIPEYEDVATVAKSLISLNYQLQRLLYGEVKMKLSVAKLIRASSR
jgi:hypothetical protein